MYSLANSLSGRIEKLNFLSPVRIFMVSTMIVNGGNYLYNLVLGRLLSPSAFSEVAIMITLLLVFSFLAMTFQIVSTKFSVELEGDLLIHFKRWINGLGLKTGLIVFFVLVIFNQSLTTFFQLPSAWIMIIFALSMPLYFVMSAERGFLQGGEKFVSLSKSYQIEMWTRFIITGALLYIFGQSAPIWVSVAIAASVVAGLFILKPKHLVWKTQRFEASKLVWKFFLLTAGYECAQILVNYSDILLVKHYFSSEEAGLYTSMALIGRMIYFITWMIVMILIPKVLNMRKRGELYKKMLLQYFVVIFTFSLSIIFVSFAFPKEIVMLLFGAAYLPVADMLWMYALATMLFALSNLFVYYFLSLDEKRPVYLAIVSGLVQVIALTQFHDSLEQMIWVQIINMSVLLLVQVSFFFLGKN